MIYLSTGYSASGSSNDLTAWTDPLTGAVYVGYWPSNQTSSSGALNATGVAYMGTVTSHASAVAACAPYDPGPTIEETGIRAGEITAFRAWKLEGNDLLRSLYLPYLWKPDRPNRVNTALAPLKPYGGNGFYCFKNLEDVKAEFPSCHYMETIVYGEVAIWGEVYEHERGYRAECVKITRIIEIAGDRRFNRLKFWKKNTITRLRRNYGVEE